MSEAIVSDLRAAGVTTVIGPADPDYESARRVWNGDIVRHPAAIARCQGVVDVIAAVNAAREGGMPLAIRGGAHSAAGHATCDDSATKIRAPYGTNYERLAGIKAKYDPGNLFRLNPNVQLNS